MAINPWLQAIRPVVPALRSGRVPDIRQFPLDTGGRLFGRSLGRRGGEILENNPTYEEDIPQELPAIENSEAVEAALERLRRGELPATASTTPASGSPAPGSQRDGESQETFDALREFQANLRAQHMTTQPQQLSVLDMLRKRMARDAEAEPLQRLGEFGAGMLASGSPNFFTMLGAGARAAREGDISRTEQLRRLADLERQDAAQRAEEARRVEELRIREAEQRLMAPYRAALTEQALATAAGLRAGRTASLTAANLRRVEQSASAALNNARLAASRESPPRTLSPAEETRIYREAEQRAIQTLQMQPQTSVTPSPAPQTDFPTITPINRPAR